MNYDRYNFSPGERILYLGFGAVLDAAIAWTFYRSLPVFFILLIPSEIIFLRHIRQNLIEKRKYELSLEFREAIMAVLSSLNAGYSVENAFIEAGRVMEGLYGESLITEEFRILTRRLRSNEALEKILLGLAWRSGIEDIADFAGVFSAAKRSGGDFTRIIRKAADSIGDKMDIMREIRTSISARKYETKIMELVPFVIIVYLSLSSSGFLSSLYHGVTGTVVMTVCLALYATGFLMAEKITKEAEKV